MAKTFQAAIVGLGSMGLGMAAAMARAGLATRGYDVNPAAASALTGIGVEAAPSAAEAAKDADALVIVVVNAAQTEEVLFGTNGAASRMKPGGVVIVCTTLSPADARRMAAKAALLGLAYLDAPISGGSAKAASGQLTIMASGAAEAFEKAAPALEAMAATVHRLGSEPGVGASYKIVNQLLAGVHIAAACEAIAFAARLGLDLPTVYKVITGSAGNSWMFENRVPHVLDGDYAPRSAVDIFVKDLGIVGDIGRAEKFPLAITAAAMQMFVATSAAGMGGDDDSSVTRMLAKLTGVALPPPKTEG